MRNRIILTLSVAAFCLLAQSYVGPVESAPSVQAQTQRRDASAFVANIPIQGTLEAKQTASLKGNMSLYFEVSPEQLRAGTINVRQFNIAFFGVPQAAISGREAAVKNGVLGMTTPGGAQIRYDAQTQTAAGEIPVQVHFAQLDELFPPQIIKGGNGEDDFAVSRTIRGRVKFQIKFTESLGDALSKAGQARGRINAQASAEVEVEPLRDTRYAIGGFRMRIVEAPALVEIGTLLRFEAAQRLCIQPVRIRANANDPAQTGAGLAFGMPGANTQWNKADVVFQVRDWMTVTNAALKVATEGAEETAIRASVNVDDCIEVFFVENFDPVSLHGGGATWSSGTANAKIITSDGNAVGGIDFTHLAHELGHVVFMGHPGNAFGMFDPSTNTLMCPSGWRRDNPTRNSRDNANHVANPLFTFALKAVTPGPDCTASADCGRCP